MREGRGSKLLLMGEGGVTGQGRPGLVACVPGVGLSHTGHIRLWRHSMLRHSNEISYILNNVVTNELCCFGDLKKKSPRNPSIIQALRGVGQRV